MQAVLLASGDNTRVSHLYPNLPKVMFPIGNRPFLSYYLDLLFQEGITELIIVVYYKKEKIIDFINSLPKERKGKVTIIERKGSYGPVGVLVDIKNQLQENFFLFYGDVLFKANLKKIWHNFTSSNKVSSFITKDQFGMFSSMEIAINTEKTKIVDFSPSKYTRSEGWMDVGQLNNKSIIDLLKNVPPEEEHVNKNIWTQLIHDNEVTYSIVGPVFDIGTERNYKLTNDIFEKRGGLKALG